MGSCLSARKLLNAREEANKRIKRSQAAEEDRPHEGFHVDTNAEVAAKERKKRASPELVDDEAITSKIEEHEMKGDQQEGVVYDYGTGQDLAESEDHASELEVEEYERPAILRPEMAHVFSTILNELDVRSYLALAAASKEMTARVSDTPGVSIPLPCIIKANANNNGDFVYRVKRGRFGRTLDLMKIEQLPIELVPTRLETDWNVELDAHLISILDKHLTELGVKRVEGISARILDWEAIIKFCEKYRVKDVVEKTNCSDNPPPLSDETVKCLQDLALNGLWYEGYASNDAISSSMMPSLFVQGAVIPLSTCQQLLEQWLTGERSIKMLGVGCSMSPDDLKTLFAQFPQVGVDGPLPFTRPFVVYQKRPVYEDEDFVPAAYDDYWIVKEDNSWVWSSVLGSTFYMTGHDDDMVRPDDIPVVLQDLL